MKRMDECTEPAAAPGEEDSAASPGGAPSRTSEAPSATRIVAKIIDPSVRDDGRGDPQFTSQLPRARTSSVPPRESERASSALEPARLHVVQRAVFGAKLVRYEREMQHRKHVRDGEQRERQRAERIGEPAPEGGIPSGGTRSLHGDGVLHEMPDSKRRRGGGSEFW